MRLPHTDELKQHKFQVTPPLLNQVDLNQKMTFYMKHIRVCKGRLTGE